MIGNPLVESALTVVDHVLSLGLIHLKNKHKAEYYELRKELDDERKKERHQRDYRRIVDLEDKLRLLIDTFPEQIKGVPQ